jgi:hypothetical protein
MAIGSVIAGVTTSMISSRRLKSLPPKERKKWEQINKIVIAICLFIVFLALIWWGLNGFK